MQFCSSCDTTKRAGERTDGRRAIEWIGMEATFCPENGKPGKSLNSPLLSSSLSSSSGHLNAGNDRQMHERCKYLRRVRRATRDPPGDYASEGGWQMGRRTDGRTDQVRKPTLYAKRFFRTLFLRLRPLSLARPRPLVAISRKIL